MQLENALCALNKQRAALEAARMQGRGNRSNNCQQSARHPAPADLMEHNISQQIEQLNKHADNQQQFNLCALKQLQSQNPIAIAAPSLLRIQLELQFPLHKMADDAIFFRLFFHSFVLCPTLAEAIIITECVS